MAWEDAKIEWLTDDNEQAIADVSRVDVENLRKAGNWAVNRNRQVLLHYGNGWLQLLFVEDEFLDDEETQRYMTDHDKWADVRTSAQIEWTTYDN